MTIQQLRYIIEVSRVGSINEAAKILFVSQPSLSMAIKDLEKELSITIFERTNKGIVLSYEGIEFLGYARQIIEQTQLLEQRYKSTKMPKKHFSVSTQHYAFAVNAFVNIIKKYNFEEYEFSLCETKTYEIIENVKNIFSEIGVLYINAFNEKVIHKVLKENNLTFNSLFKAKPHIFISATHPLASKNIVELEELVAYPCLSFEQGAYNSFHFSEEILSTVIHNKTIKVSDRATLFNFLIGLNGYTISTGVLTSDLNGNEIISIPLKSKDCIEVGWICHNDLKLSQVGSVYIEELKKVIQDENKNKQIDSLL